MTSRKGENDLFMLETSISFLG